VADGWLQVAQEVLKVPGVLVEIYGDLARPGVRQVGKALETVLGLGNTILWPVALANERSKLALERNLERYRLEMEKVPEGKVVGVCPELGVPIAEKLSYVEDDSLSAMYAKLLATGSNLDTLALAHPSFVNVINNLSPDEAHLLAFFATNQDLPISYAVAKASDGTQRPIAGPLASDDVLSGLHYPENIDAYLSNLDGLGLLKVRTDQWLAEDKYYESVESKRRDELSKVVASDPGLAGRQLKYNRGIAQRTSFGQKFILACHKK
jgi:hypothetical protein